MSDLVDRLRAEIDALTHLSRRATDQDMRSARLMLDAADEIERLRHWQVDAGDTLLQCACFAYVLDKIPALLARAGHSMPEWLVAES